MRGRQLGLVKSCCSCGPGCPLAGFERKNVNPTRQAKSNSHRIYEYVLAFRHSCIIGVIWLQEQGRHPRDRWPRPDLVRQLKRLRGDSVRQHCAPEVCDPACDPISGWNVGFVDQV